MKEQKYMEEQQEDMEENRDSRLEELKQVQDKMKTKTTCLDKCENFRM